MDTGSVMNGDMNLSATEDKEGEEDKGAVEGALSASSSISSAPVKLHRPAGAPAGAGQAALPGLGPDPRDRFRFTWHNTRIGAPVLDRASQTLARGRRGRARA